MRYLIIVFALLWVVIGVLTGIRIEQALAGPATGTGSEFTPSTSYSSCSDPGGGVCLNSGGGIQVASPFGEKYLYAQTSANSASCGTKASPQANASTCNGDSGFVSASSGTATVTLGNPYSDANHYGCIAEDYTAGVYDVCTPGATSISITSASTDAIFWHTFGVSGG